MEPLRYKIKIVPSEIWKDIDENYRISDNGRFMSRVYHPLSNRNSEWKLMNGNVNSYGYHIYFIGYEESAHVLVAKYFIGENPNPDVFTVDHIDKDRLNNDISNLRYASNHLQARNRTNYADNIYYDRNRNKFQVGVQINKKRYRKRFNTFEEAMEYRIRIDEENKNESSFGNRKLNSKHKT